MLMGCGFGATNGNVSVNVKVIETSIVKLSMENQFRWRRNYFNTDFIAVN